MKGLFNKILDTEIFLQRVIAVFLVLSLTVLVVIQVVLRYVFKTPLMGIEELMLFPTIWLYMLGGANASQQRNHIDCGVLSVYIKRPKTMMLFEIVRSAISVLICSWLMYWAYWFFMYSLKLWKVSDLLYIPMFLGESAIFIGLILMFFFAVHELIDQIKIYTKSTGQSAKEESQS
jgi:TRAP-type C4-dicarboxylate transport system permease small subunit